MTSMLTRRSLLKTAGAAGAAAAGTFAAAPALAKRNSTLPAKWDKTVDVLVVGTGFAGLAAGIEAHDSGAKNVLIIEKLAFPGGNSAINGGDLAVPGTEMQAKLGIKDSPELLYQDMLKAGGYINQPALCKKVAYSAMDNFKWCRDYLGVNFWRVNYHGGHAVKRAHQTKEISGSGIIMPMLSKLEAQKVPVQVNTKLEEIYVVDNQVKGVRVRENFRFPDAKSGKVKNIRVTRGLVLATGGFSQNVQMRKLQDPRLDEKVTSTNMPGAQGEGIQCAQMVGAIDVHMDWIQCGPWTSPDEEGFGLIPQFCEYVIGYGLMVDPATGKRFFKETGNRKERADAIFKIGHPVLILADETNTKKQVAQQKIDGALKNGALKKFNTLDELAAYYKMPAAAFKEQVARWNGFVKDCKGKTDPDLGCRVFEDAAENVTPPFYCARLWPRVHHTMGGLAINEKAEVLNAWFKPIKGLYAAGEVTGGVHGMVRLGSLAGQDCITFGREAGRNAAKNA